MTFDNFVVCLISIKEVSFLNVELLSGTSCRNNSP